MQGFHPIKLKITPENQLISALYAKSNSIMPNQEKWASYFSALAVSPIIHIFAIKKRSFCKKNVIFNI